MMFAFPGIWQHWNGPEGRT